MEVIKKLGTMTVANQVTLNLSGLSNVTKSRLKCLQVGKATENFNTLINPNSAEEVTKAVVKTEMLESEVGEVVALASTRTRTETCFKLSMAETIVTVKTKET